MKPIQIFGWLFIAFVFIAYTASAERPNPPRPGYVVIRNSATTNIPTAYGSAGAEFATGQANKTHVKVINKSAADLGVSLTTTASNCTGGTDNDVVPATSSSVSEPIQVNTKICIRSLSGSAITSGMVYLVLW